MTSNSTLEKLPAEWRVRPLGELLTCAQYGLSVRGDSQGAYPILRMTNQVGGRIVARALQFADVGPADLAKYRLEPGDLLFNRTNSLELVGRTAIFELDGDFVFASYLIKLRTASDRLNPHFLNFYLNGEETQRRLKSIASRAVSQSNISATRLKGFEIPVPPLDEQRQIAAVLSAVQRAIERQERLIALTAELKKALMHKLFTEGTRGEPQKQTEIGRVPDSWTASRLGTIARFSSGGTPSRDVSEYWAGGTIPWVKTTEIDYCTITETEERITQAGLDNSSAKIFPARTLLVAMYGQGVTRGRVGILGIAAATNQACAAIMPHSEEEVSTDFLYYFLEFHYENLRQRGHGANQTNLSMTLLKQFPMYYPKRGDQKLIVDVLQAVDQKRAIHERERTALTALFRTLLHQLMTAQIRVHDLDLSALSRSRLPDGT